MKARDLTEERCPHGSITHTEISLEGKSFGDFGAPGGWGSCSVVFLLELPSAWSSQDAPRSPLAMRGGKRDLFPGDCSANGNLAGQVPGQPVIKVKLALLGAGG